MSDVEKKKWTTTPGKEADKRRAKRKSTRIKRSKDQKGQKNKRSRTKQPRFSIAVAPVKKEACIRKGEVEGSKQTILERTPIFETSPSINHRRIQTMSATDDQMRVDPARTKALIAALHSVSGRINVVAQGREVSESHSM
jgi:hypothetical protein